MLTHSTLLFISDAMQIGLIPILLFYCPFAKCWNRAFWTPCIWTLLWGILRFITLSFYFEPDSPPPIGFIIAPPFYGGVGCAFHGIGILGRSLWERFFKKEQSS